MGPGVTISTPLIFSVGIAYPSTCRQNWPHGRVA